MVRWEAEQELMTEINGLAEASKEVQRAPRFSDYGGYGDRR